MKKTLQDKLNAILREYEQDIRIHEHLLKEPPGTFWARLGSKRMVDRKKYSQKIVTLIDNYLQGKSLHKGQKNPRIDQSDF